MVSTTELAATNSSLLGDSSPRTVVPDTARNMATTTQPAESLTPVPLASTQSARPTVSISTPPSAAEPEPGEPVLPTLVLSPDQLPQGSDPAVLPESGAQTTQADGDGWLGNNTDATSGAHAPDIPSSKGRNRIGIVTGQRRIGG